MKSILFILFSSILFQPVLLRAQQETTGTKKTDTLYPKTLDTIGTTLGDTLYTKLNAVVFSGTGTFIKNETDRTILQIEGRPALVGMNALELLKQSPGVVVDPNENILMGGKSGVMVYIDDKPSLLSGQDLAQLLKSIDASNIRSIELISNPSARYDAAGNAGIINIRLKKSLQNGLNGNLNASNVQSIHSRQNFGTNLNFRKNNWNLFFNGSGYNGFQQTIANTDRKVQGYEIIQRSLEKDRFHGATIRTGIDYKINKLQTVGITWMHNRKYSGMDNLSNSLIQLPGNDSSITSRSVAPFENSRNSFNLNYVYEKNKLKVVADADHLRYGSSINNEILNSYKNEDLITYKNTTSRFDQSVDIHVNSFKLDLLGEIKKWKVESGIKLQSSSTNNIIRVFDKELEIWMTDTLRTNFFDFKENITAIYGSVSKDLKKITLQFGLRAEYSNVKGNSTDLLFSKLISRDTSYINLFPTVYFVYRISADHTMGLVFNRRIDRPAYQDQNPFIYALDAFNYEQGNPYLTPQFSNALELNYTYKYASQLKIKYSETKNYIEQLTFQEGRNTVLIPQNAGTRKMLNIVISTPFKIKSWWNIYGYAEPYYQEFKVNLEGFGIKEFKQSNSWGFNSYLSNTITLPKNWKLDLSYWLNFQNTTTIYTSKPLSSLNLGIQKILAKDKLVIKIGVTDLLNDQKWQQSATTSNLNLVSYRKWESRSFTIGLSFRFGNEKIKAARERESETGERISDSR